MTLQNGAIIGRKGYLWSDTAFFSADGSACVGFGHKAFHGLQWPWVASTSTVGAPPDALAQAVGLARPGNIPELLESCRQALASYCVDPGAFGRLQICAYDRREARARLFLIASQEMQGFAPFTPMEGLHFVSSHIDSEPYQAAAAGGFTVARMHSLIDAQRATPALSEMGTAFRIGGECLQFEVTPHKVIPKMIRDWTGTDKAALAA